MVGIFDSYDSSNATTDAYLHATMRGLESGLTVGTIASSPITTCEVGTLPDDVLERPEWSDFDVLPVEENQRIVATIERRTRDLRPLDSSILVSSSQSLAKFIATPGFVEDGYRLVLDGASITGIVTPSDLLRLPVRVLAFALISHLEHTMNTVIDAHCANHEVWLQWLSADRKAQLETLQQTLSKERMNPDLLEFAYFSEKINILNDLKVLSNREADKLGGLNELRNQVAHNRDYVKDHKDLRKFISRMQRVQPMIEVLAKRSTPPQEKV